jgi:hypothetical protein
MYLNFSKIMFRIKILNIINYNKDILESFLVIIFGSLLLIIVIIFGVLYRLAGASSTWGLTWPPPGKEIGQSSPQQACMGLPVRCTILHNKWSNCVSDFIKVSTHTFDVRSTSLRRKVWAMSDGRFPPFTLIIFRPHQCWSFSTCL